MKRRCAFARVEKSQGFETHRSSSCSSKSSFLGGSAARLFSRTVLRSPSVVSTPPGRMAANTHTHDGQPSPTQPTCPLLVWYTAHRSAASHGARDQPRAVHTTVSLVPMERAQLRGSGVANTGPAQDSHEHNDTYSHLLQLRFSAKEAALRRHLRGTRARRTRALTLRRCL